MCFNPRPPRGGRLTKPLIVRFARVSIRAPRAGGDLEIDLRRTNLVSIRAPRAGGDKTWTTGEDTDMFQSAPPARGATRVMYVRGFSGLQQNLWVVSDSGS